MPTTNPVPSTDPTDLLFNAQKLDEVVNGTANSFTDRLGVSRRSLSGIDAAADNVLNAIGYSVPVAYASGISLTLTSQTVDYNGVVYAPKSSALPFTTSSWGVDSAKFRAVQVTDADLITYTPAGTGAVATTVQSKLRETVSVFDFMTAAQIAAVRAGTSTDDTEAIQDAINHAAGSPVRIPAGTYKIGAQLFYDTTGLGVADGLKIIGDGKYKTILNNNTGGVAIRVTAGNSASDFQYGVDLSDFSIANPLGTGTKGILLDSCFKSRVNVRVIDQTSHGINLLSTVGDATDCSQVDMSGCETSNNGGDGIRIEGTSGAIHSEIWVDGGRHVGNSGYGINLLSAVGCTANKNAIAYNLAGGINVTSSAGGAYSKLVAVSDNEFDSNAGTALKFGFAVGCKESRNYYVCNPSAPVVTKLVDIAADARHITSEQAQPRLPVGYTGVTAFTVASGALYTRVIDPVYTSWQASGNTKYSDAGTSTTIVESNAYLTPVYGGIQLSGGTIKFPVTQVASSDVNTLDDYEEGTWTPVDSSGAGLSFTGASGFYTKIGRLVTFSGQLAFPVTADTSNIAIGGLPFQIFKNSTACLLQDTANAGDMALLPAGTITTYVYGPSLVRRTNAGYSGKIVYFSGSYIVVS